MAPENSIALQFEFTFRDILVRPGMFLKVNGFYGIIRYECIVHNTIKNRDYIIGYSGGERVHVPIERLRGVVEAKRSRRKKFD